MKNSIYYHIFKFIYLLYSKLIVDQAIVTFELKKIYQID